MSKLEIDLVPSTCWYSNLRELLTPGSWDKIRKECYKNANNKCEICEGTGVFGRGKIKVECHEKWEYKDGRQILTGVISLCCVCHRVKHFGLSSLRGYTDMCKKQLASVNNWSPHQVVQHINESFKVHEQRSQQDWVLDLSWLKGKDISFKKKYQPLFKVD